MQELGGLQGLGGVPDNGSAQHSSLLPGEPCWAREEEQKKQKKKKRNPSCRLLTAFDMLQSCCSCAPCCTLTVRSAAQQPDQPCQLPHMSGPLCQPESRACCSQHAQGWPVLGGLCASVGPPAPCPCLLRCCTEQPTVPMVRAGGAAECSEGSCQIFAHQHLPAGVGPVRGADSGRGPAAQPPDGCVSHGHLPQHHHHHLLPLLGLCWWACCLRAARGHWVHCLHQRCLALADPQPSIWMHMQLKCKPNLSASSWQTCTEDHVVARHLLQCRFNACILSPSVSIATQQLL